MPSCSTTATIWRLRCCVRYGVKRTWPVPPVVRASVRGGAPGPASMNVTRRPAVDRAPAGAVQAHLRRAARADEAHERPVGARVQRQRMRAGRRRARRPGDRPAQAVHVAPPDLAELAAPALVGADAADAAQRAAGADAARPEDRVGARDGD